MGTTCGRLLWENWALRDATVVTVSSEQLEAPKTFLDDPIRSKRWRTKLGWNIVAGFNDKLDFTEGVSGAAVATLTPGNYASATDFAAHVQAEINAVATDNTYTVFYSGIGFDFTIIRASGAATIDLDWSSGPNTAATVGEDMGFDVSTDDTGLTSYTADADSFGSRSWIQFDLGTDFASLPIQALIAFDGNFGSTTTITVQANTTATWTSPPFSVVLSMDSANDYVKGIAFIASTTTYRYWRFFIEDTLNTDGFTEMGIPYLGDYQEPSNGFSAAFTENRDELTSIDLAEEGASFQHVRNTRFEYPLQWLGIPTSEKPKFDEMAEFLKIGRPFFVALEPAVDIQKTLYMMLMKPMKGVFQPPSHWRFNTDVIEVLG